MREIALILAADGAAIPSERILGRVVDCDNFQDARRFLANGGEKGRQRGILTAGTYRINTALFTVITSETAVQHEMMPAELHLQQVERDQVGIVTTLDGKPIEAGKIAEEQRKTFEVQEAAQVQRQQLVRQTSLADIQQQVVGAEQGVSIAELKANAGVKRATGDAESTRLRALGEAEAIRATGNAKAEAYRVGVAALGAQAYTVMQLMQTVGERIVRIVPEVSVTGREGGGMVDGLLGLLLKKQADGHSPAAPENAGA